MPGSEAQASTQDARQPWLVWGEWGEGSRKGGLGEPLSQYCPVGRVLLPQLCPLTPCLPAPTSTCPFSAPLAFSHSLSGASAFPSAGFLAQGDNPFDFGWSRGRTRCQVKYSHRNLRLFLQRVCRRTTLLSLLWLGSFLGSAGCHPNCYCRII